MKRTLQLEEERKERKNTAIFVSGLPEDVSVEELADYFGKYGIIMDDMFKGPGHPRIKLYYQVLEENGNEDGEGEERFKGEALIVYLRQESAQMAVEYADESLLRPGSKPIKVVFASFASQDKEDKDEKEGKIAKKEWKRQMQQMNKRLQWTLNDGEEPEEDSKKSKYERIVIIENLYTQPEWKEALEQKKEAELILELKAELVEECDRLALSCISSVKVLPSETHCRCAIKFREREAADKCRRIMNGRAFDQRRLVAYLYDGSFSMKERKTNNSESDDDEELAEQYGDWLEKEQ